MKLRLDKKIAAAGAGLALAAGAGGAIAATRDSSPTPDQERQAVINDVAKRLGVQPTALTDAFKAALIDQVDAAVAAGRLTKEQADAIKARIQSGQAPFFGGPGGFDGDHHDFLAAAASYLGLTEDQIFSERQAGKSLAQIATEHGKTADGLVQAMVAAVKTDLDKAVSDGKLTSAQEQQMLGDVQSRTTALVNSTSLEPRAGERFWGPRSDGPAEGTW